jgi:2,4-dienoyl-CoA reductase [(3E)-enoyl-CoA-producing], peroxisomal
MPLAKHAYLSSVWRDDIYANKVVFCTGGAGTICSAQVRALVHLGADACIVGRNQAKTEAMAADIATARPGARVLGLGAVDVRKLESLEHAVARCVAELGAIDFVIAGAAGNFLATIGNLSANAFKSVVDIDLLGSYNTVKATLPHLLKSAEKCRSDGKTPAPLGTGGRIIFISATLHYSGTPLQAAPSAAKAGVDALSTSLALELGPRGITSNVIAPGPIEGTEGMDRLANEQMKSEIAAAVPVGRQGAVKDIADATVWLFSDAANFVNGTVVVVDGGDWHTASLLAKYYPGVVLQEGAFQGVKGAKKEKSKL